VLPTEALKGTDDALRLLAIVREGERDLVAEQPDVEGAAERRRGDEVDVATHGHARPALEAGARLVGVVLLRAATAGGEQPDEDRAKHERQSHARIEP